MYSRSILEWVAPQLGGINRPDEQGREESGGGGTPSRKEVCCEGRRDEWLLFGTDNKCACHVFHSA